MAIGGGTENEKQAKVQGQNVKILPSLGVRAPACASDAEDTSARERKQAPS